jgi:hypothetical protein
LTAYSLRSPAGFLSHRQRSWDSPFGAYPSRKVSRALPPGWPHLPFRSSVIPMPKHWAGPTGCGFWGSTLPGVLSERRRFSSPLGGCSLGSSPFQGSHHRPCPGLLPRSFRTLHARGDRSPPAPAPRSVDRSVTRFSPRSCRSTPAWTSNPHRVSAPASSRTFERSFPRAMCSPHIAPRIAAGCR